MARRSSAGSVGLVALVALIIWIPKEVWITMIVLALAATAIYFFVEAVKKKRAIDALANSRAVGKSEPTLAELIGPTARNQRALASMRPAQSPKQVVPPLPSVRTPDPVKSTAGASQSADISRVARGDDGTKATGATDSQALARVIDTDRLPPSVVIAREEARKADARLTSQSKEWNEHRDALARANRELAEHLRAKHPPAPPYLKPRSPSHDTLPSAPSSTAPPASAATVGSGPDVHDARLRSQSPEWSARREALAQASRKQTEELRNRLAALAHTPAPQAATTTPALSTAALEEVITPTTSTRTLISASELTTLVKMDREHQDAMLDAVPTVDVDGFYSAKGEVNHSALPPAYAVPTPSYTLSETRWVDPTETVDVGGVAILGGMFYLGSRLLAGNGDVEPSLIDPRLYLAQHGDYRDFGPGYYPSYSTLSPTCRRAYLAWLSEGRNEPSCNIGYVLLFFYGLERRVVFDTPKTPLLRAEWPSIAVELRRLIDIYGSTSEQFKRWAARLLDVVHQDGESTKLYLRPLPQFTRSYEFPFYLKLALGQCSVDRAPVPAQLALAWVRLDPLTNLRTAAIRCPSEFDRLFCERYSELLGQGLVLPKNRTKLKFVYDSASPGWGRISKAYGDIPDATAMTKPLATLMEVARQCTDELGPYSRLVGKDPTARNSLDATLLLPVSLWSVEMRERIETLRRGMHRGLSTLSVNELVAALGGSGELGRERARSLARALKDIKIGFEPDLLQGAKYPASLDPVVLFEMSVEEDATADQSAYQMAALTLQLASAVAFADSAFNDQEIAHLRREIDQWSDLTVSAHERLHAHLSLLIAAPMTLASVKKRLEPLELKAKESVARFMATLAQSDGVVSRDEVRFLEKVYKALGVESKRVFSDIHAVEAGVRPVKPLSGGFRLDTNRIAALEQDTARVSALLSQIFIEEDVPSPPQPQAAAPLELDGLLGLDEAHSVLLRLLLSRPTWSRSELEDAAADLDLMLDGALEVINDASFYAYDIPLSEGEDPIEINPEMLGKIKQ